MNRRLTSAIDYAFLMTSEEHYYISSSLVREVAMNGGDIAGLVPEPVEPGIVEASMTLPLFSVNW